MKLKSKLIATIVSICAAIAVMGVGVWAAQTSFTVNVENSVNLSFVQLDGVITVGATTGATTGSTNKDGGTIPAGTELYNSTSEEELLTNEVAAIGGEDTSDGVAGAGVVNFLTMEYINTAKCQNAYVEYTFKYVPATTDANGVVITLTETQIPAANSDFFETSYYVSLDGDNWHAFTTEAAVTNLDAGSVFATAKTTVYVKAICTYTNTGLISVSAANQSWDFNVKFDTANVPEEAGAALTDAKDITETSTTGIVEVVASTDQDYTNDKLFATA